MNSFINYLIEANLGLIFFFGIYWLALKNETQFALKRFYLLGAILVSMTFPLMHFNFTSSRQTITTVSHVMPANWLPELIINATPKPEVVIAESTLPSSLLVEILYFLVMILLFCIFIIRLTKVFHLILRSKKYTWNRCLVSESNDEAPTFSFFKFIFIGKANKLNKDEKEQVLHHEAIHVTKLHSVDVIVINLIGILFWFNPIVKWYKKTLEQLHEYEADAHAIANLDVDAYCGLLAKLALRSSEFSIANHFSKSVTVKRISMMKSKRKKTQSWKLFPLMVGVSLFFFAVSCHDQVGDRKSTEQNAIVEALPPTIKTELEKAKKENPGVEYTVIEVPVEGKLTRARFQEWFSKYNIDSMNVSVIHDIRTPDRKQRFLFLGQGANKTSQLMNGTLLKSVVVEEMASPKDGMDAFQKYLLKTIEYPESARKAGIEGKVIVSFIVNPDGTLSDFNAIEGIGGGCDREAIRVLSAGPAWKPARQQGIAVKQLMVIPITFIMPTGKPNAIVVSEPVAKTQNMDFGAGYDRKDGKVRIEGTAWDKSGKPLAGANVVLQNTTEGTTTGSDGHFKFETAVQKGTLIISYVGFNPTEFKFY